ncbi:putative zinc-finger protein [Scheffersomyces stipitis CBS 6054]|uniref:Putative zinc-finger protein n=1 Tax=Scheffersomyces stipitis (strain ATCC 58785 / CBS 6054 / NBRC 10063 / NRRL Y-11545) TaxID=322104 RepID=A3LXH1_PICST|nr:putative zinc-finger protein [Scheffersomyces stipitis CBS 6054]ABN67806.2 putative zinc-finger protein [Scheffersomyces stipitis CBS 6054]KAG2732438.1 hypothetical protein G9P44_004855 [Scheffersomyces stipitis]
MAGNVEKPKPLKVFGRTHYACTRCKLSKIKCSGEKPACSNCKSVNKEFACVYPAKDRKIVIMESDLNKLHDRVEHLETLLRQSGQSDPTDSSSQSELQQQTNPSHQYLYSEQSPSSLSVVEKPESYGSILFEDVFAPEFEDTSLSSNMLRVCEQQLPDRKYAMQLLEKVYATYSSEFYLIDIAEMHDLFDDVYSLFRRSAANNGQYDFESIANSKSGMNQTSFSYLFAVLAFGEQLLNVQTPEGKYPGIKHYLLAERLFRLTKEQIDFTFIQCALLLGLYAANLSRYNTVYNYLGVAARSAVAQGYHRQKEIPKSIQSDQEIFAFRRHAEKAKLLWWSVFVIDTTWATKTVHFQYTDTDVDLPCENTFPLSEEFDPNILEVNVHLTKYIAKFVRLIYGPNIRTFSINYINTNQFNQKLLLKNIIKSSRDLVNDFETPLLGQFKDSNIIERGRRNLANLFLRYHQLIILITKPSLSLVFDASAPSVVENYEDLFSTISKGLFTSCATIDLIANLFVKHKIFVLGFWDSQHLFAAILYIIIACLDGKYYPQLNIGIALLRFMAQRTNINAKKCFDKLVEINKLLMDAPEVKLRLNLYASVADFITDDKDAPYNPLPQSSLNTTSSTGDFKFTPVLPLPYLPEPYRIITYGTNKKRYSESSRSAIFTLINEIQGWDD